MSGRIVRGYSKAVTRQKVSVRSPTLLWTAVYEKRALEFQFVLKPTT